MLRGRRPGQGGRSSWEIKTDPGGYRESADPKALLDAVLRDLTAADWADDAKIIAFDWSVLRDLKAKAPAMATAHPDRTRTS